MLVMEDISDRISRYFENDIDCSRLSMLLDMIRTACSDSVSVERDKYSKVADAMDRCSVYKGMLTEIDKLLRIYFYTFPVTSATAEWSFSSLRRLKACILEVQ